MRTGRSASIAVELDGGDDPLAIRLLSKPEAGAPVVIVLQGRAHGIKAVEGRYVRIELSITQARNLGFTLQDQADIASVHQKAADPAHPWHGRHDGDEQVKP